MAFYFFYQKKSGPSAWEIALASERQKVINEVHPALVTVLDVNNAFESEPSFEESLALKYNGPIYFDFDTREHETLDDVLQQVRTFMDKLKESGVDLDSCRFFLSGSKGVHIEMPLETAKEKVPPSGITALPYVLKEFAFGLYVETLDLKVYTGRRGRMWRCPNVLRDNGKYKVACTAAEIYEMDGEKYVQLCSEPRPAPHVNPPKLVSKLAVLFSMAEDKVAKGMKARKNSSKVNAELIRRYKGEWPDTLKKLMAGEGVAKGVGFNKLALQLAVAAHALGKTESDFLNACEGVCDKHESDGDRYNTFYKRRNELARLYGYMQGNVCWEYSPGPIKAMLEHPEAALDLEGGDPLPESAAEEDGDDEDDQGIGSGVKIVKEGLFVRTENGWKKASDAGLGVPSQLIDTENGTVIGYELELFVAGKSKGQQSLTMNHLQSKQSLQQWTSSLASASVQANDAQVSAIQDVLRRKSEKLGNQVYVARREGIDMVLPLGARDPLTESDVIWSHIDGVDSRLGLNYKLIGSTVSEKQFKSDLYYAPEMLPTEDLEEYIHRLVRINKQDIVARVLGWFFASFLTQPIRRLSNRQFPTLHAYGESGAGKSSTINLIARLHYYNHDPVAFQASSGTTLFTIATAACQSASIPVILEEVKVNIDPKRMKLLEDFLKNNYTGEMVGRGTLRRETAKSDLAITNTPNVAPLVVVGEQLLTTTALMERFVPVVFSKATRTRARMFKENYEFVSNIRNRNNMGVIGKRVAQMIMSNLDFGQLADLIQNAVCRIQDSCGKMDDGSDRPIFNLAITLVGLDLARRVLGGDKMFGTKFDEDFDALAAAVATAPESGSMKIVSEASKVLDVLGMLSHGRLGDPGMELIKNHDYTTSEDGKFVDVSMKYAFVKYMRYCRNVNQTPLYDTAQSFVNAMRHYSGTVSTTCLDNTVLCKNGLSDLVFRFSTELMEEEGVEPFAK